MGAMAMYYVFLFRQGTVSFAEFEKALREYKAKKTDVKPSIGRIKYDLGNPNILAVTRTVGNYNEQLVPFLIGMYLYASFVSVRAPHSTAGRGSYSGRTTNGDIGG